MSRAFTKEDDASEDLPERPIPSGPNYVTARGLEMLKAEGERLVTRRRKASEAGEDLRPIDRDLRYLESRIASAIVVPVSAGDEVRFGARVTSEDDKGARKIFTIVGDDEARTEPNTLSWSAPLAEKIFGLKAGAEFFWQTEDETVRYKVLSVEFEKGL